MLFASLSGLSAIALLTRLLILFSTGSLLFVTVVVIYRLTLHPLARYPGPFLAKITDWHQVYHAWKGDRHLEFWRNHEKYGKYYRFGPNSLSINSASALKKIYGFDSNVRKSDFYSVFPPTKDTFNTHSSIDKAAHARKRRVLSHAFSDSAIKQMERYILANIRTFCEALGSSGTSFVVSDEKKGWSAPRNMADWCNYLTFDIMGDLCFGKAFGMLERPDNRFAIELIGNAAHRHLICGTLPPLHTLHLDKILFHKIAAGRSRYMAYSRGQATERMSLDPTAADRRDFFYWLMAARDPHTGQGFSVPELWGESNLLIIAGSDTTSTALAAVFFYLVHAPEKLQRLTHEVRAAFNGVEDIVGGKELGSLVYLRAVLDESMRLSPPVGGLLPRTVLPGGLHLSADDDSLFLPVGINVGVPHYALHHNPLYYPSPYTFLPERWIPSSFPGVTAESTALARSAFCAFSVGPRGCIGKGMAYTELGVAVARTLWLFDMRLSPGLEAVGDGSEALLQKTGEVGRDRRGEYQLRDSFTSLKDGPMVEFRARIVE